jgi:hypothetical protein
MKKFIAGISIIVLITGFAMLLFFTNNPLSKADTSASDNACSITDNSFSSDYAQMIATKSISTSESRIDIRLEPSAGT